MYRVNGKIISIPEDQVHQLYSAIRTGGATGMVAMEKAIRQLLPQRLISYEEAGKRGALPDNI